MRTLLISIIFFMIISSCITPRHVNYTDPNYLESNEFSTYEELTPPNTPETNEIVIADTTEINNYNNEYYDYSYTSRLRRFHRPLYYSDYYGSIYTDYYWYNHDPFYCGTSIYYGYNWYTPYYYSPYHYNHFYTPYFYGNYYGYYGYGHNHYNHYPTYTYYNNQYDNNRYTNGHRGSLSTMGNRGLKRNAIIANINKPMGNINNLSIKNVIKNKIDNKKNVQSNNSYSSPKSNNSYSSPKSNNNRGSSGNNNRRNIKPKK